MSNIAVANQQLLQILVSSQHQIMTAQSTHSRNRIEQSVLSRRKFCKEYADEHDIKE